MPVYTSVGLYIETAASDAERYERVDAVIDALEAQLIKAAANENIAEYSLDDGQTKISTVYRSVESIEKAIFSMIRLKNYYANKLNGRVVTLVDSKNIKRRS